MKRFTKMFLTLALLVVAGSVNAQEKVYATFANPTNTAATWNKENNSFKWSQPTYNQIHKLGLLENENENDKFNDISNYKTVGIKYSFISGDQFRLLFYCGSANLTIYVKASETGESGVAEFNIYESLKNQGNFTTDFILKCKEICLSGAGNSGEVKIEEMWLETYGPDDEKPAIFAEEEEQDPGRPAGEFVDLEKSMFNADGAYVVGEKKAKGDFIYGDQNKDHFADLTGYSKLTIVSTPNMPFILTFNHEVDEQQNKDDYSEGDEDKYVWIDAVTGEDGIYELDLTNLSPLNLNYIRIPWSFEKMGTVWYLLLTEATSIPVTIGEAGYATFCSKKAVALESSVEAYAVEFTGTSALLTAIESSVDANTPVILKAEAGVYDLNIMDSGVAPETNDLKASDGSVAGNGSIYVLANGAKGVGFYLLAEGVKIPAGKAYLEASAGGREFIGFDGEATAVKSVETVKADGAIYNLAGQQVKKAQKGVFIIDGKKVIK